MNPFTPVVTYNIMTRPTTTYITPPPQLQEIYYYSSLMKDKNINQAYYKHPLFYDFSQTPQKATSSAQHLLLPFFTPSHFSQ